MPNSGQLRTFVRFALALKKMRLTVVRLNGLRSSINWVPSRYRKGPLSQNSTSREWFLGLGLGLELGLGLGC